MASVGDTLARLRSNPRDVRFNDAIRIAEAHFGPARGNGSHHVFRTPWPGDPRVNLQEASNGKAKAYQVRQLLAAIDRLEKLRAGEAALVIGRQASAPATRRGGGRRRD